MWKQISDWFKGQFTMATEVAQLRREVEELRRREENRAQTTEQLYLALRLNDEQWRHEHANLLLKLENELLKFERRLPPSRPDDDPPKLS